MTTRSPQWRGGRSPRKHLDDAIAAEQAAARAHDRVECAHWSGCLTDAVLGKKKFARSVRCVCPVCCDRFVATKELW